VAAIVFVAVVAAACLILGASSNTIERFYYAMNIAVNHRDMRSLNGLGDFLAQDYLSGERVPDTLECVILGSSYTASSLDSDPSEKIEGRLSSKLSNLTGERWKCVNLATNGAVTWSYFYIARLLRKHRPPDVLVVSLDVPGRSDRNAAFVLDLGLKPGDMAASELAFAVPINRQPLYVSEANLKKWLRENTAFFKAWNYASFSYPTRENIRAWINYAVAFSKCETPLVAYPSSMHADGTPKSWKELPVNRARIEKMKREGYEHGWNTLMQTEFELLFDELDQCRKEGIRVVVTSMPFNPEVPQRMAPLIEYVAESTARRGLAFHNYWVSGIIPTEYYVDNGHFFGEGCRIMADELAKIIVSSDGSNGSDTGVNHDG